MDYLDEIESALKRIAVIADWLPTARPKDRAIGISNIAKITEEAREAARLLRARNV